MTKKQTVPKAVMQWRKEVRHALVGKGKQLARCIPESLVLAMIWQESDGDPYAIRREKRWRYFIKGWDLGSGRPEPMYIKRYSVSANRQIALQVLGHREFAVQSCSWGLMQVMGSVARERGFKYSMPNLWNPEEGIDIGVKHLWIWGFRRGKEGSHKALWRYNGSEVYAKRVLAKQKIVKGALGG